MNVRGWGSTSSFRVQAVSSHINLNLLTCMLCSLCFLINRNLIDQDNAELFRSTPFCAITEPVLNSLFNSSQRFGAVKDAATTKDSWSRSG